MRDSKSSLECWFPRLVDAALPVPRTEIVRTELDLSCILDGPQFGVEQAPEFDAAYRAFLRDIESAADAVGYPCFLRTGLTSGKHRWKDTYFIPDAGQIVPSVIGLIEFSALADMMGLPTNIWAVREYLPVDPVATLPRYGDIPLVPEMRCFVNEGKVLCSHPYWPSAAIAEGLEPLAIHKRDGKTLLDEPWFDQDQANRLFAELESRINVEHVLDLAGKVAEAFAGDGYWSVDILLCNRGLFVTDMAEGKRSWHYEGCEVRP